MSLAASLADFAAAFAANFNRRDPEAFAGFYAADAVMDLGNGQRFEECDAIRPPHANFLAPGFPIAVSPRSHAECGDLGVAVFDWSICHRRRGALTP